MYSYLWDTTLVEAMQSVLANDDSLKVDLEFEMEDQPSEEPEK